MQGHDLDAKERVLTPSDRRIRDVLQLLRTKPGERIEVIAQTIHLSASRLKHLFKQQTHMCIRDFSLECRLQVARHLLLTTETSIKEIAYSLRYSHASSFVRAFRRRFGQSPKLYRENRTTRRARR